MDHNTEIRPTTNREAEEEEKPAADEASNGIDVQKAETVPYPQDVFGDEEGAEVKYKVLKWWYGLLVLYLAFLDTKQGSSFITGSVAS